jgi:hypothetical protein
VWSQCAGPTCTQAGVCSQTGSDDHCICNGVCLDQMTRIDCENNICSCYVNGLLVGSCASPTDDCDFTANCCLPLFALPH